MALHFPDDASDHSQVGDECRILERFALHPVHGNVGQRRVADVIDRKRFSLDRAERTVGDRQHIDGRVERVRRQFFRVQVFQYHLLSNYTNNYIISDGRIRFYRACSCR